MNQSAYSCELANAPIMGEMPVSPPSLPQGRNVGELVLLALGAAGSVAAGVGLTEMSAPPLATGLIITGITLPFAALLGTCARARQLRRRAMRRAEILDATSTDVVLVITDGRIVQAGGATGRLLGCAPDVLLHEVAQHALPLIDPSDFERLLLRAHTDRPRPVVATNVGLKLHDGRTPTVDLVMHQPDDPSLRDTIVRLIDATDRYDLLQRLGNVGALDPVSRLDNRQRLVEQGDAALRRAKRTGEHVAVLAIHLDGLQAINEAFGPAVTNEVVLALASRLAAVLRTEDLRGRHADDVFIAIVAGMAQDIGRGYAVDVADRITESLAAPIFLGTHELALKPWIGIAHRSNASGNPDIEDLVSESLISMNEVRRSTTRWNNLA